MRQAVNLANHPRLFNHVALMADCHRGYGMPIGGVVASESALIPNAVGVDIGCGVSARSTSLPADEVDEKRLRRLLAALRSRLPVGEGKHHAAACSWSGFDRLPQWLDDRGRKLARRSLGTLGGGNHFVEVQASDDGSTWLMAHSGSRNLGYRIAKHHHREALRFCRGRELPDDDLAWLPADSAQGRRYLEEMGFAMEFALENRRRIMEVLFEEFQKHFPDAEPGQPFDIHHNYASLEAHMGRQVWVHRKGAISAREGLRCIVPGSMGSASYIVRGLGEPDSFRSSAHGAGRRMSRRAASRSLALKRCNRDMEGVVFDGWSRLSGRGRRKGATHDLSEAPAAYKDIEEVMIAQSDLVSVERKLRPLAVLKG